ncbi:MAG: hypothetical protein LBC82_05800 [Oscillospiraceae bacterium]|nr:hypothetical protein [Oscillospiraceae bacterium]
MLYGIEVSNISVYNNVKEQLSIIDVAQHYGIECERSRFNSGSGRMVCCPFHDDRNPSMKLYEEKNGSGGNFHCFGCGEHGDAIDLVSKLFNLAPLQSAEKLTQDFGLTVFGVQKQSKPSIKKRIERHGYVFQENRAYKLLADYCDYLKQCRSDYAPKSHLEEINPLFLKSLDLEKYQYYKDIFIDGSKDERQGFIKEFDSVLSRIEKTLNAEKPKRHNELIEAI